MLRIYNSYVLWLLRCVELRLVSVTLSDVYVTWCYVLYQHHLHCLTKPNTRFLRQTLYACTYNTYSIRGRVLNLREWRWTNPGVNFSRRKWFFPMGWQAAGSGLQRYAPFATVTPLFWGGGGEGGQFPSGNPPFRWFLLLSSQSTSSQMEFLRLFSPVKSE